VRAMDSDRPERAWGMLDELLETGVLVLGNGSRREASTKEILSAVQFVASRQALKHTTVPLMDDLNLKKTDGTDGSHE
jgi:hypothetical protein